MILLIGDFWNRAKYVCQAKGHYGSIFRAGRGITQGGPLSARLFNILVDAVVREWMRVMRMTIHCEDDKKQALMATLFAIFYVDDTYIAAKDPAFLQHTLDILVETFQQVGPDNNTKKTVAMICTLGKIRVQLPKESSSRLKAGISLRRSGRQGR